MKWFRQVLSRRRIYQDLTEEIRLHLDEKVDALMEGGLSREEAERQAKCEFGNVTLIKEQGWETWQWLPVESVLRDIRDSARRLRKSPVVTISAVLTLAIGVGSASAIFCLLDALWFRPLPVERQHEIVRIFSATPDNQQGLSSWPQYQDIHTSVSGLRSVFAIGGRGALLPQEDGTQRLLFVNVVSANFFEELGIQAATGGTFKASDAAFLREHPSVVLGDSFWKSHFHSDPAIVGQQIFLMRGGQKRAITILGVLPPSFREVNSAGDRDLWMPPETWEVLSGAEDFQNRDFRWVNLLGRLTPNSDLKQTNTQLRTLAQRLELEYPAFEKNRSFTAISDLQYRFQEAGASGALLICIVVLVLGLCVVNVGHQLLAQGLARRRDLALRLALGATRIRLMRQSLIETLLLAFSGMVAGIGCAFASAALLPYVLQTFLNGPVLLDPHHSEGPSFVVDWRVFSFAFLAAIFCFLLLSIIPLWQCSRLELTQLLRASPSTQFVGGSRRGLRGMAVSIQIAISLILLVAAGALSRSFLNTRNSEIGLSRKHVLLSWGNLPKENPEEKYTEAVRKFQALPGVRRVAWAIRAPLSLSEGGIAKRITLPDHPELRSPVSVKYNAVSSNFLDTIGTRILRGSGFTAQDDLTGPPAVIINHTMAERYWPRQEAVGKIIHLLEPAMDARIVGVAENAAINRIGEAPEPYLYLPFRLIEDARITFAIETTQSTPLSLGRAVRDILIRIDPQLDPLMTTSLGELIRFSAINYHISAALVSGLSCIGLLLAAVGLYGFLAWQVERRTPEIGIRMALGASRWRTVGIVLREVAGMTLVGVVLGLPTAVIGLRLASSLLFGVQAWDSISIVFSLLVLGSITLIAAIIPAQRAANVQPMEALRTE